LRPRYNIATQLSSSPFGGLATDCLLLLEETSTVTLIAA
jgi:hypothetical protein